ADTPGAGGLDDGIDGLLDRGIRDDHLDPNLGEEVHHVLRAPVELGVSLLAPEPLDLGDGQAADPELGQRLADLVQLERLDDGGDLFHSGSCEVEAEGAASGRSAAEAGGDRLAPVPAEGAAGDAGTDRPLPPLVLVEANQAQDPFDRLPRI